MDHLRGLLSHVRVAPSPLGGSGIFIDQLSQTKSVVAIPESFLIFSSSVARDDAFRGLLEYFGKNEFALSEHETMSGMEQESLVLVLYLMFHKWLGDASPLRDYISSIPPRYTTTAYWPNEILECLEGSALYSASIVRKQELFQLFTTLLKHLEYVYPAFSKCCDFDLFLWASTTLDSRAFRLLVDGRESIVLTPLADMINHSFEGHITSKRFDSISRELVLSTENPIPAGELLMCYGPFDNARLLLFYGFAVDENPHDRVELLLDPPDNDSTADLKMAVLQAAGWAPAGLIGPTLDGLLALVHVLRILLLPDCEASAAVLQRLAAAGDGGPDSVLAALQALGTSLPAYALGPVLDLGNELTVVETLYGVLADMAQQCAAILNRLQRVPPCPETEGAGAYVRNQLSITADAATLLATCADQLRSLPLDS